jgi:hypothetical protein
MSLIAQDGNPTDNPAVHNFQWCATGDASWDQEVLRWQPWVQQTVFHGVTTM